MNDVSGTGGYGVSGPSAFQKEKVFLDDSSVDDNDNDVDGNDDEALS